MIHWFMRVKLFKVYRVEGKSLSPVMEDGDYVITIRIFCQFFFKRFYRIPRRYIVFRKSGYPLMIKAIRKNLSEGLEVVGFHWSSVDSREFGLVKRPEVIAVVLAVISRRSPWCRWLSS